MADTKEKITLALRPDTLQRAREEADRAGVSLSAWVDRVAHTAALRAAGDRYEEWINAHPEMEGIRSWRAFIDGSTGASNPESAA
jgi:hypothetical protein